MKRSSENCRRDDTKLSNEINVWMGDADGTLSHWCFNVGEHMQGHIATHSSTFFKITRLMVSHQFVKFHMNIYAISPAVFASQILILFSCKT